MPYQILQRDIWDGTPRKQGNVVFLSKTDGSRTRDAIVEQWTHRFGWELLLLVYGEFVRSQVCRSQEDVLSTIEAWTAALHAKGWA